MIMSDINKKIDLLWDDNPVDGFGRSELYLEYCK